MKAILVIDMPTMCDECKLHYKDIDDSGWFHSGCVAKGKAYDNGSKVQDWCPLKPMPQKKNEEIVIKGHTGEIAEAYQDGWNACLYEILGETE